MVINLMKVIIIMRKKWLLCFYKLIGTSVAREMHKWEIGSYYVGISQTYQYTKRECFDINSNIIIRQ